MKKLLVPIALVLGTMAQAGGFRVSLQGVKQLAMAHTSAHAEDASVAFFNPAGMSFIPNKLSVVAGGFGVAGKFTYQNLNTLESHSTDNPLSTPVYAAIAYKITDKISVGVSTTTPYGSSLKWGENWTGSEMIQDMKLQSIFIQPAVSVKLANWASVGVSYIYAKGKVDWNKSVTLLNGSVNINDEKATGHGFGLGFYFRPDEKLDVSITYRSPVDIKAKNGVATLDASPALFPVLGLDANGQGKFTATLPLVDEYTIGATYRITPKWQVSADFNYYGWGQYDTLTLDFESARLGNQPTDRTLSVSPKNFKNSFALRFGTQYMITEKIAGRLGYYYDESPYDDENYIPDTPSHNNNVITAGLGFKFNKFGVDLSGGYALFQRRDVKNAYYNFYGEAKAKAIYFGLGLSYNPF